MSLTTPTISDINDQIISNLEAELGQTIPFLPKSFLRVLAKTLAAVFILLYKYAGFTFLQIFVATASSDETEVNGRTVVPLEFWGDLIGAGTPTRATQAELVIDIDVTTQGGTLASGSQLVAESNGITYITIGAVSLNAATVQATVRAVSDEEGGDGSGTQGNLTAGQTMSFANPISDVARETTVASQSVTGADAEDVEVYRQRVVDRFQKRPQGGALADYELWGEEVEGIVNVYPYTGVNPGEVDVYCEATVASSGSPDGIPTGAQLTAVADSIDLDSNGLATRRPANAAVNVNAITRAGFEVEIQGLIVDNAATVQADIDAELDTFFLSREPYINGLSVTKEDLITKSAVGGIVFNVVSAAGGIFSDAILTKSAVVTDVYTLVTGEKAKVTSVTYT